MASVLTQSILVVEDDENDQMFMKLAFEKAGIVSALQLAEDGEMAIDYLAGRGAFADRRLHPLPALVLLDLKLPRVMGMDVLQWIRAQPELDLMIVVVVTSSQHESDIRQAYALRANSYLVKPTNPLRLGEIIALVKSYWMQANEPTASLPPHRLPV